MTRRTFLWIKIAVALVLFGIMIYSVKPGRMIDVFLEARFDLLAVGIALMPINLMLQEGKWRYLIKLVLPSVTFSQSMGSMLGGMAFGVVTPGRLGEYARALFITSTPPLKLVGLTVIDKLYNLGCTIAFGFPALMTLPWALGWIQGNLFVSLLVMMGLVDLLLLYLALDPRPVRSLIYALQIMIPRHNKIAQLIGGLDKFSFRHARVVLTFTLAHYLVYLLQYFVFISAFYKLPLLVSFRGAAAVLFSKSALPIAIGDIGLDQLVSVKFFGQFGAPPEAAFDASIVLFAVNVLTPALIGLFFMGRLSIPAAKITNGSIKSSSTVQEEELDRK